MGAPNGRLTARTATRAFIPHPLPNLHHGTQEVLFDSAHIGALFETVTSVISYGRGVSIDLETRSGGGGCLTRR
jgi:hypothetical protein